MTTIPEPTYPRHACVMAVSPEHQAEATAEFVSAGTAAGHPVVIAGLAPETDALARRLVEDGCDVPGRVRAGDLVLMPTRTSLSSTPCPLRPVRYALSDTPCPTRSSAIEAQHARLRFGDPEKPVVVQGGNGDLLLVRRADGGHRVGGHPPGVVGATAPVSGARAISGPMTASCVPASPG